METMTQDPFPAYVYLSINIRATLKFDVVNDDANITFERTVTFILQMLYHADAVASLDHGRRAGGTGRDG